MRKKSENPVSIYQILLSFTEGADGFKRDSVSHKSAKQVEVSIVPRIVKLMLYFLTKKRL